MFEWEKYSSELYVEREQAFDDLLKWANSSSVPKQVRSLVAPPGAGKSWFLRAVQEKLEGRKEHPAAPPERLVIFCDVPSLVNRDPSVSTVLKSNAVFNWLENIQKDAVHFCSKVRSIDRSGTEIARAIDLLVTDLCEECTLRHPVVVLVDGLDEVTREQSSKVEEQILERFIGKKCVRLVIAHRDEDALWHGLRNYTLRCNDGEQSRLCLSELPSVHEQFRKFRDKFYPTHLTITNLDQFMGMLPHYRWKHAYVNAFLFDQALSRNNADVTQLLTAVDLRNCLFAVIERRDEHDKPRFGELEKGTFDCLKQIASKLPDDWALTDLEKQLGLKEQDACIKQLFRYGVILYNSTAERYQLAEGIRELARDLVKKEG